MCSKFELCEILDLVSTGILVLVSMYMVGLRMFSPFKGSFRFSYCHGHRFLDFRKSKTEEKSLSSE